MDTGTNQPEFPNEPNESTESSQPSQPNGPNRNRRRRRRGGRRGSQPANQQNARSQNSGQGQQRGFHGQGQFGHRRGNQQNRRNQGGGQGRRRRGGRGGAPFVGPMDHSYRNANGNFNGTGPNGRYRTPGFQQPYPAESEIQAIAGADEGSGNKIICFVDDLFFLAKIQEVARKLGVKVEFVKADKESLERITEGEEKPALIIFDLNNANAKPLTTIPKLRSKLKKGTSIVGFLSHLQGDLKMKAQEAGCDMVVPRSAFSQNLPALLRRHSGVNELTDEGM
ncbi:MAG TPA: response regulator [Terriglobales bacterium]